LKHYRAPRWLSGHGPIAGNVQTIWPARFSRIHPHIPSAPIAYQRERWASPDGDFVDVDFFKAAAAPTASRPLLVLFHGLEGSSQSHYAKAFAHWAHAQGWDYAVPHFRGCSGELNLAPRTYHSGDFAEVDWILRRLHGQHTGPLLVVGISLGGNVLLRWAQEAGSESQRIAQAIAAVCAPLDLAAAGHALGGGFNRMVYTRMFINSMKPKALAKLKQHPGLFNEAAMLAAQDLHAYDNAFTAPLHGFANTEDYWARCSAKPGLKAMKHVPALVLNARNDPFVPASSLPGLHDVGPAVTLWQPAEGGHVGFPAGAFPGHVAALPEVVGQWLKQQL
jgi:uncharacterized protein